MVRIPLAKPNLGEEEIKAVSEVIRSLQLSLGQKLVEFEKKFADFIGVKHAVAVNSGTSGLHLCMKGLNIGPGDEVITSSFSFVASTNPLVHEGGRPVFVDIDTRTYNIDADKLEDAITEKTKAILVVHLFGQPCDMDKIMRISEKRNIPVIEDACEALGAQYRGRKAGSFGSSAVFGFYPNKQITTGEGGMIVTNDEAAAALYRSWRNQGRDDSGEWLNHIRLGFNYRLDEMSCAIGIEQLKKLDFFAKRRQELADRYSEKLRKIDGLILPYTDPACKNSWWVYYVQVDDDHDRDSILKYLNVNGVSSRVCFYPPIHLQPIYKQIFNYRGGELPFTERVSRKGFIIPFFVDITDAEMNRVCETIKEAMARGKK